MKSARSILYFLDIVGLLLVAGHLSLTPLRSAPRAVAQTDGGVAQAPSNDAGPSLLFADDFERGTGNWQLNPGETGSWEVRSENGNQVLHGVAFATTDPGTAWDDYRGIEARVRVANSISEAKIAL